MDRITTNKFKSLAKEFGCPCKVISSYSAKFDDFFLSKLEEHFKKFAESRDGKDFKDLFLSEFEVKTLDNKRFTILKIKD